MAAAYANPQTIILGMHTEVYEKFDNSSIEEVWKILRLIAIPHFSPELYPVPYIHAANYFDFLNVYTSFEESGMTGSMTSITNKILNKLRGVPAYRYAAKLKDVIRFSTSDLDKVKKISKIYSKKMKGSPYFEYAIEGEKDNVIKSYFFKAQGLYESTFTLTLDDKILVKIDRTYPGLEKAKYVLVISKVHSANKVLIKTICGDVEDVKEWSYKKSVPLALDFLKLQLDDKGFIKSMEHIRPSELMEAVWVPTTARHSPECTVLQTVCDGKFYSLLDQSHKYEVTRKPHHDFKPPNLSLKMIWTLLRQHPTITKLLGGKYCPIPYLEDANFFDMFNVFSVIKKLIGLKNYTQQSNIYQYVDKLGEILICGTEEAKKTMKNAVKMFNDPAIEPKSSPKVDTLHIHLKIDQQKYEIMVDMDELHFIGSNLMMGHTETGKSFLDIQHPDLRKVREVVIITAVCVAKNLRIHSECTTIKETGQKWVISGIVPIAFQGKEIQLSGIGEIKKHKIVSPDNLLSQDYWHLEHVPYPEKCAVLQNYFAGVPYDPTGWELPTGHKFT